METLGSPVVKKEIHNQSVDMSGDETGLMWIAWEGERVIDKMWKNGK